MIAADTNPQHTKGTQTMTQTMTQTTTTSPRKAPHKAAPVPPMGRLSLSAGETSSYALDVEWQDWEPLVTVRSTRWILGGH